MEGMFNPLTILLHMFNAALLLVALYFLLLKPVRKFMTARTERVQAELKSVDDAKQQLDQEKQQAQSELVAARKTAQETIAQSVASAHEQAEKLLKDAHQDADYIMKHARAEADAMQQNAREAMRGEVAGLSVQLAGRLLQREVNEDDHQQLVEDFLTKVV